MSNVPLQQHPLLHANPLPQHRPLVHINPLPRCRWRLHSFPPHPPSTSLLLCRGTDGVSHELIARQEAHKRIIWACSWNPFGHEFATGSRDKTVKIWAVEKGAVKQLLTLPQFTSSVTALSWACLDSHSNDGVLAVGMESGVIELWRICAKRTGDSTIGMPERTASLVKRLDPLACHVSSVHRLAWRNSVKSEDCKSMLLASCGADHCLRIFEVYV